MSKKPLTICITGGKGGTGKTLVAVNLATLLKKKGFRVLLVDGDVENPNTYLLLKADLKEYKEFPYFIPKINEELCSKCGLCAENCHANALLHITDSFPIPMLNLCSGCKLCFKICPEKAIEADSKILGKIYSLSVRSLDLFIGELTTSEARSAALVKGLLDEVDTRIKSSDKEYDYIILDTAPGAHCDVEELINYADIVVPVTEPTKFGQLDLLRIIDLINLLNKDYKVIINRSTLPGYKEDFLKEIKNAQIELLGEIPLDENIVDSYCNQIPLMENTKYSTSLAYHAFNEVYSNLMNWCDTIK
jgi:MinD superfamily P-loop ATPase